MANRLLLNDGTSLLLLNDGTSKLLLNDQGGAAADVFIEGLDRIELGIKAVTAAGMDGVLVT